MSQNLDGYVIRKQGSLVLPVFGLLLLILVVALGFGFLDPIRLGVMQETVMQIVHGGIVTTETEDFVETCVPVAGQPTPWTVIRTRRKVTYGDGHSVEIITREPYAPCQ
jgi:hypothetical protein